MELPVLHHSGSDVFSAMLMYMLLNIPAFLIVFFLFQKRGKSATYFAFGYWVLTILVYTVFYAGGSQWGIGQSRWHSPQLATGMVFVAFIAVNLLFWRFLLKLTGLKAYLFSFFMSILNTIVCFLGMPLVH